MQKKERMANLEVLRCVAMMMVVVLHYLGKGGLLPDLTLRCPHRIPWHGCWKHSASWRSMST